MQFAVCCSCDFDLPKAMFLFMATFYVLEIFENPYFLLFVYCGTADLSSIQAFHQVQKRHAGGEESLLMNSRCHYCTT